MKLHVIFDRNGTILAATRSDPAEKTELRVRFEPIKEDGQSDAELDVPAEHANLDLVSICQRARVDISAGEPVLRIQA